MTSPLPPSALALRSLVGGPDRRANPRKKPRPVPDPSAPFEVDVQFPAPGVAWSRLESTGELETALEAARSPLERRYPEGTLLRVRQDGGLRWLGVVTPEGEVEEAPPCPRNAPARAVDWLEAWEGPHDKGDWMLGQCGLVERTLLAEAVATCLRADLDLSGGARRMVERGLTPLEGWARGFVPESEVRRGASMAERERPWEDYPPGTPERQMVLAATTACRLAGAGPREAARAAHRTLSSLNLAHGAASGAPLTSGPWRRAVEASRKRQAALVREVIPLGLVLLARRPLRARRRPAARPRTP